MLSGPASNGSVKSSSTDSTRPFSTSVRAVRNLSTSGRRCEASGLVAVTTSSDSAEGSPSTTTEGSKPPTCCCRSTMFATGNCPVRIR